MDFSSSLQDPFMAFHINKDLVRKYMNSLLIGELAPEQPSPEPTKNVSERPCLLFGDLVVEGEGGRCLHRTTSDSSWESQRALG